MMSIEDNSAREFQKLAQAIIDKLCEENSIPKIPVVYSDTLPQITAAAMFNPSEYKIEITKQTNGHALVHEFVHYILELLTQQDSLNENFTERASLYYEYEMRDKKRKVDTAMKEKFDMLDKQQEQLMKQYE